MKKGFTITINPNSSKSKKMNSEELVEYYKMLRGGHVIFKDRKKFDKKQSRKKVRY